MGEPKDILVKKKAWFIKFFMWCWEDIKEYELDQCRVFWGLLFFPIGILLKSDDTLNMIARIGVYFLTAIAPLLLAGYLSLNKWLLIVLAIYCITTSILLCVIMIFWCQDKMDKLKNHSPNAKKVLNIITLIGSTIKRIITKTLKTIFYIPVKIIVFVFEPFVKLRDFIDQTMLAEFVGDNTGNFFKFIINYVVDFKDKHCRRIKLV